MAVDKIAKAYANYQKNVKSLSDKGYYMDMFSREKFALVYRTEQAKAREAGDTKRSIIRIVTRKSTILNKKQIARIRKEINQKKKKQEEEEYEEDEEDEGEALEEFDFYESDDGYEIRKAFFEELLNEENGNYDAARARYNEVI